MEYITVQEAAEKWNISVRLIQRYCMSGRVEGAQKFSGAWAIPAGTPKPVDLRKTKARSESNNVPSPFSPAFSASMQSFLPLINAAFTPGHCMEYIEGIQNVHRRNIALAEYYYFSGRAEESARLSERYISHPETALCLSGCMLYAYANLTLGRIQRARYALAEIRSAVSNLQKDAPPQLKTMTIFTAVAARVLLHLPLPQDVDNLQEFIRYLPPGLRIFALYVQAHRTYLQGDYGKSVGIVETAFAMGAEQYPIPAIYMHLAAVMGYMSLKQSDRAQAHLLRAWEMARPDDLIEGFGEHHGLLGGMLEAVIKPGWPEDFKRIIDITYRFSAGWRKVHNPVTGHDVADNLTTTEFATAMLAARGWTNAEIAAHLGISPNTVKQYISSALQKLNIRQRKELKKFMLR